MDDYVYIHMKIVTETDKGILLQDTIDGKEYWMPKSQIEKVEKTLFGHTFKCSRWFARNHGISYVSTINSSPDPSNKI